MIKRIGLSLLIIVLGFGLLIRFLPKDLDTDQSQWSDNLIKAQAYLYDYDAHKIENVIIGSSLSSRIMVDSIGTNVCNLAFIGLSAWDGFEMIKHKEIKPKVVFIELNLLLRPKNENFQDFVFSKVRYLPKKYFAGLRERNQPVGILKGLLFKLKKQKKTKLDSTFLAIKPLVLDVQIAEFKDLPNPQNIEFAFDQLQKEVDILQNQGIKVVFFEIPMEEVICNSVKMNVIREKISKLNNIKMLPTENCQNYHTADGLHLTPYFALKYSKYLKERIFEFNK